MFYLLPFSVTANIGALGLAAVRNSSSEAVALPKVIFIFAFDENLSGWHDANRSSSPHCNISPLELLVFV